MPSTTTFRIGGDLTVGRLGFGAMHLPTERPEDRPSAIAVARRAVELGVTLIDTAHMYGVAPTRRFWPRRSTRTRRTS